MGGPSNGLAMKASDKCVRLSASQFDLESDVSSDPGMVSVTFDNAAGLTIISCTPAFTRLCGQVEEGAQLLDWISNKEAFLRYLQQRVDEFSSSCRFGKLRIRTPHAVTLNIDY